MIDILFSCWNRREFTEASLACLITNTDWNQVRRLVIYDDGSEDGTREQLDDLIRAWPLALLGTELIVRSERDLGPVQIMQRHIDDPNSGPVFAKLDNDVCVPPGWLGAMLGVLDRHPEVELLGMEAGMAGVPGRDGVPFGGVYGFEPATNIGGVGLMRLSAFHCRPAMRADGRNGFSEFQHTHKPTRGWITPDLPVVLLDRLPFEPWLSLSREYVERGWQRPWATYDPRWMEWAWQWFAPEQVAA